MSGDANFLSRWSRLKREAEGERLPAESADAAVASETTATPVAEITPEELAGLPRVEDLTAETDLSPFMRVGVPASLRNAALRRMWSLDPAIRDRVGDALDYAYDWNSPGGVPGAGQLLASDDVERMLRSVLGEPDKPAEPEQSPLLDLPDSSRNQAGAIAAPAAPPQPEVPSVKTADAAAQTSDVYGIHGHGGAKPGLN